MLRGANYSSITITNSEFSGNRTNTKGGVLDLSGADYLSIAISKSEFTDNSAYHQGGVLEQRLAAYTSISITNCKFTNNSANYYDGGVLHLSGAGYSNITITNSKFANNSANDGGVLDLFFAVDSSITITNSEFIGNRAQGLGGAMDVSDVHNTIITISDCNFTNNSSHNGNSSLIDLVSISCPDRLLSCETVPPLGSSDHLGVHLALKRSVTCNAPSNQRTIWRYKYADYEKASKLLERVDLSEVLSGDMDTAAQKWEEQFLAIMEECIPKLTITPGSNLPWLLKELRKLFQTRNEAFKRAKRTGRPNHQSKYKHLRNKATSMLCSAKSQYFSNLDTSDCKAFWRTVKSITRNKSAIPSLEHNGSAINDDQEKAEVLNSFFAECFNSSLPSLSSGENFCSNEEDDVCPDDFLCYEEEVLELLQSIDTTKANGPDGISGTMLKATAYAIFPSVTALFNKSIRSGIVLTKWKEANVTPIPKGSNTSSVSNYSPISLLSALSKLLERHMHSLIHRYLMTYHPLAIQQWGFQPHKSTVSALLDATHKWSNFLEKGLEVVVVFFDLKKSV